MGVSSDPILDPLVGSKIGRYAIQARVGEGGMGIVYRAEQTPLGRPVALKVIHSGLASDQKVVSRFMREAKISCQLTNPHTVTIFDFGNEDGVLYLAMELLLGESLHERLCRGPVEPVRAAEIAAQVCRSLMEAHKKGIIHRDLKPDNIFLGTADDGTLLAKVLDYGLARVMSSDDGPRGIQATLTQIGTIVGTPIYMSPEQARGRKLDARTDLYSMGIVLFEMLSGVAPFLDDDAVVVLGKHIKDPVPRIAETGARVAPPPALQVLVDKLLAKEPSKRPPDAAWVFQELRAYLAAATAGTAQILPVMDETSSPGVQVSDPPQRTPPDAQSGVQERHEEPAVVDEWEDTAAGRPRGALASPTGFRSPEQGLTPLPPLESQPTTRMASDPSALPEVDSRAVTKFPTPKERLPATFAGEETLPLDTSAGEETRPLETSEMLTEALTVGSEPGVATPTARPALPATTPPWGTPPRRLRNTLKTARFPFAPPLVLGIAGVVLAAAVVGAVIAKVRDGSDAAVTSTQLTTRPIGAVADNPRAGAAPGPGAGFAALPPGPGASSPPSSTSAPVEAAPTEPVQPPPPPQPEPPQGMLAAPPGEGGWTGSYTSNRGSLELTQRENTVTGTFGTDGRLQGTAHGAVLLFEWSQRDDAGHGVLYSFHARSGPRVVLEGSWGDGTEQAGQQWSATLRQPRAPRKNRPVKRGPLAPINTNDIFGPRGRPGPRSNNR